MNKLSEKQNIQENIYEFPYHHIPSFDNGNFHQAKSLRWGYEYLSYIRFILKRLQNLKFESLLDVGCGDGKFLYEAQKYFPQKRFTGLDLSKRAIAYTKALNPNIEYVHGNITDTSLLSEKFDIITLVETLEHIPIDKIKSFIKGIDYYLKKDGFLIITVPSKNIAVQPKHYQHFDVKTLANTLSPLFVIKERYFINKISSWTKFLESILSNRLFILNERHFLNMIYRGYGKYLFSAKEKNARRIFIISKKTVL